MGAINLHRSEKKEKAWLAILAERISSSLTPLFVSNKSKYIVQMDISHANRLVEGADHDAQEVRAGYGFHSFPCGPALSCRWMKSHEECFVPIGITPLNVRFRNSIFESIDGNKCHEFFCSQDYILNIDANGAQVRPSACCT